MLPRLRRVLISLIASLLLLATARATVPTPPFKECPAVGADTSCRILLVVDDSGGIRAFIDPNVAATYTQDDDILVGVLNLSSKPVSSLPLRSPNPIFGFDDDGICSGAISPQPSGCPFGPTGYEGPGVSFSSISDDVTAGVITFTPPLAPDGGTAYFGLEEQINNSCRAVNPPAPLKQSDNRWAANFLGNSNLTVADYGCLLTDLALEINYYAQQQSQSFRTDPAALNTFLTLNQAYDPATGEIYFGKLPLVASYALSNGVSMYFEGVVDHRDDFAMNEYLCGAYPPAVKVGSSLPHWVMATSPLNDNGTQSYADMDPDGWPNGDKLNNSEWNNTYWEMVLFSDNPNTPREGLYFIAHAGVELVLTAADGSKTGYNPQTKQRFGTIPKSSYSSEELANDTTHGQPLTGELKQLTVTGPVSGDYYLQVFGTASGNYELDIVAYDSSGNSTNQTVTGAINSGNVTGYQVNYSSLPGSQVETIPGTSSQVLRFIPATPCRIADTRDPAGPFGGPPVSGGTERDFVIPQSGCNIPATAAAYSLNLTVVPHGGLGYATIWPTGLAQPYISILNSWDGRVKANAAIVGAGTNGAVSVYATDTTDVILDINGYFVSASDNSSLAFYPLAPCRVADTRTPNGPLGGPSLQANTNREFPMVNSTCNIPSTAQAYSLNFTSVPHGPLGFLTVWPSGESRPYVSTLNSWNGAPVANAAIVPAGMGGDIDVYASNDSDLVIDINGYFAPENTGALSLYLITPCRVLDSSNTTGAFLGELTVAVMASPCSVPRSALAYVLNATVVPTGALGYLSLWPDGTDQPLVSTLNSWDGAVVSNMAIVPTSSGSIDAYASDLTNLILDISSFFAP